MEKSKISGRKSKIAVGCKWIVRCRGDEGQWEKSEIAVGCKCSGGGV